jgi:HAD superfamily hydrolase (TIGR01549 family)
MKLVIFDFDKTIMHIHVPWHEVKAEVASLARQKGIQIRENQHLVPMGNELSKDPLLKSAIDQIYLKFEMACANKKSYQVYPEMLALVRELKAKGFRIAIVSGNHSKSIETILSGLGMLDKFDFICGRDKVENGKPSAEPTLMVMNSLGAEKAETLFVGDSIYDSMSAKAAGVAFFRVAPGSPEDIPKIMALLG